jgi:hypothetical protein
MLLLIRRFWRTPHVIQDDTAPKARLTNGIDPVYHSVSMQSARPVQDSLARNFHASSQQLSWPSHVESASRVSQSLLRQGILFLSLPNRLHQGVLFCILPLSSLRYSTFLLATPCNFGASGHTTATWTASKICLKSSDPPPDLRVVFSQLSSHFCPTYKSFPVTKLFLSNNT